MTALVRDPMRDPTPLAPRPGRRPPAAGAASLALRPVLDAPRRPARVIAVFPSAVYLEPRGGPEPRVIAVVSSDAVRLPNAVVVVATCRERPFRAVREGGDAWVGDGRVETEGLETRVRRWWEPSPALGAVPPAVLARGVRALEAALRDAGEASRGGLAGHPDPVRLADRCAAGDLAGTVEAAERIVGLGPGLTPSGDDILSGLLLSLRLLGGALRAGGHGTGRGGGRAEWMADWLGAAVTADAGTRTTALAATLLHCAASGAAGAEVAAVLRAVAGHEPAAPAVRRLLAAGHTSGADLAAGVLAGCRAALALAPDRARAGAPARPRKVPV
ncbi:hypothetical protein GCM10010191_14460 [Actinomadura vinacea]|uniref:DUF2877 domain-containing protein n=1 Tax=Actinomadura vinacea TaxID=115336 RepID=A0ABP5VQW2_9ACTN